METITDLKAILHSKRANLFYVEYCRVMQKDGRVLYLTEAEKQNLYWNIPIANTTCLLLGTGTSITQAAMRMLASAGVLVGFCGGGGTPLLMANEIEWLSPQNEYRPTEYIQQWLSFWFNESARLAAAQLLQLKRLDYMKRIWAKDRELINAGFDIHQPSISKFIEQSERSITNAESVTQLLNIEALLTKQLYKQASAVSKTPDFQRIHKTKRGNLDHANGFLNHGNYLAYGLAATTLWVLGIPHGFAVMHGKTRRGALVFDIADLVKDTLILPWAFICASEGASEQEFRQQCLQNFTDHKALDVMFDTVKQVAAEFACDKTKGEQQ